MQHVPLHDHVGQRRVIRLLVVVKPQWGVVAPPAPLRVAVTVIGNQSKQLRSQRPGQHGGEEQRNGLHVDISSHLRIGWAA